MPRSAASIRTRCRCAGRPHRSDQPGGVLAEAIPTIVAQTLRGNENNHLVAEVEVVAAGRRAPLALVLRSRGPAAIGVLGGSRHLEEGDLTDLHARVERDRQRRHVGQLEGEVAVPARVDKACGRVDQQPEPAQRALALEPRHEIVGQRDPLERRPEHELARVQNEAAFAPDLDQLGEVFLRELRVDVGRRVVAEHPKEAVDAQVDRRRLHAAVHQRVDDDAALGERLVNRDVGEEHGPTLRGARRFAGRPRSRLVASPPFAGVVQRQNISFPS